MSIKTESVERQKLHYLSENHYRVILIQGMVGAGKTYLLNEMSSRFRKKRVSSSIISLSRKENRVRAFIKAIKPFFSYHIINFDEHINNIIKDDGTYDLEHLLEVIETNFEFVTSPSYLMLDNFHNIEKIELLNFIEDLSFIKNLHLVLCSREVININLEHLSSDNEKAIIGYDQLRFDLDEVQSFFGDVWDLHLRPAILNLIYKKFDGWPGALAAIIRKHVLMNKPAHLDNTQLLEKYSGFNQDLIQYLDETFYSSLDQDFRLFLIKSSLICDRNEEALKAFSQDNKREIINQLFVADFIETLGNKGDFYFSYSEVLQEYFEHKIKYDSQLSFSKILKDAAAYFVSEEDYFNAVHCYIEAKQYKKAAQYLPLSLKKTIAMGNVPLIKSWFRKLPAKYVENDLNIILLENNFSYRNDWRKTEKIIDKIEEMLLDPEVKSKYDVNQIRQRLKINRITSFNSKYSGQALENAMSKEVEIISQVDAFNQGTIYVIFAISKFYAGNYQNIEFYIQKAIEINQTQNKTYGVFFAKILEIIYLLKMGSTSLAASKVNLIKYDFNLIKHKNIKQIINIVEGLVYYDMSDINYSYLLLSEGIHYLDNAVNKYIQDFAVQRYATIAALRGLPSSAYFLLEKYRSKTDANAGSHAILKTNFIMLKIMLISDDVKSANNLMSKLVIERELLQNEKNIVARLHIENDNPKLAIKILKEEQYEHPSLWDEIERDLILTIAYHQKSDDYEAILSFQEVLRHIPPTMAILFLEHHKYALLIIEKYATQILATQDRKQKLKIDHLFSTVTELHRELFPEEDFQIHAGSKTITEEYVDQKVIEPLSKKEKQILNFIVKGHTNKAIAEELGLSINTVKWHVRHILEKFGVQKRTQVIALFNQQIINGN